MSYTVYATYHGECKEKTTYHPTKQQAEKARDRLRGRGNWIEKLEVIDPQNVQDICDLLNNVVFIYENEIL